MSDENERKFQFMRTPSSLEDVWRWAQRLVNDLNYVRPIPGPPGPAGAPGSAGPPGPPGGNAVSAYLTLESLTLFAYASGDIVSYALATGFYKVFDGSTDVSSNFVLSTEANPQGLVVTYTGQQYAVTGGMDRHEDIAVLSIRATGTGPYLGVVFIKDFTITKAKGGYEIVSTLPTTNLFHGRVVFLTTDGKLYRYVDTVGWTAAVPTVDLQGQIIAAQLANAAVEAAKIADAAVTEHKIAVNAITASKVVITNRNDVFPDRDFRDLAWHYLNTVPAVSSQPSVNQSQPHRFLRVLPSAVDVLTPSVPVEVDAEYMLRLRLFVSTDFAGWIGLSVHFPSQAWHVSHPFVGHPDVDAGTYPVVDFSSPLVIKGQWLSFTQRRRFLVNPSGRYLQLRHRWNCTAGYFEFAWEIVRAASGDLIVDGAITTSKLAAGSVVTDKLAADAVLANNIAAGAVTTDKIEAGAITAAKLATTELITVSAQIGDGLINTAKIVDGAINTAKIANAAITDAKIANLSADKITAGTLATARLILDGQTISANGSGQLIVPNAGIGVDQLTTNAVGVVTESAWAGTHDAVLSWTTVVLSSQVVQLTFVNNSSYNASVILFFTIEFEETGFTSGQFQFRITKSTGGTLLNAPFLETLGTSGRRHTVSAIFTDTALAANTTVTYSLQVLRVVSAGTGRVIRAHAVGQMLKRT